MDSSLQSKQTKTNEHDTIRNEDTWIIRTMTAIALSIYTLQFTDFDTPILFWNK